MLIVWITLLLWAAPTQGVTTHCVIPAVERFQDTSLTCKFSDDISTLKQDFKVQFYKSNTTDSTEVILDCYWVDKKPECTVHKCCEYDGHVTETLTLRVLNVTESRVGRYVCFVLPAAPDSYNFCYFNLTEKQHTVTSERNLAALAALILIPVIIYFIIIIIIIWRRKRSQKAGDKTTEKKPCHFWPGQWRSPQEKPGDEESSQPLKECKDEENDGNHSRDGITDEDLHLTDPKAAEKLGQKSDNIDRSQTSGHTSVLGCIGIWTGSLFGRGTANQNVELSCTPQQEQSTMKNDPPSTSVTGPETNPEEIQKDQTVVDKNIVSDVTNNKALNKQVLPESGTNVSSSGTIATVTQKMKSPSDQNDVIQRIPDQSSDDDTHTTRETSQILGGNEFQTENEATDQKTQKSDVYNHTTNIEGRKAKSVRKVAKKKEKIAQDKAEKDEKISTDKAEKDIKSAREKAEKEKKLVKENAEKEEATAKRKAEELEKIAKEKAEKEERIANDKAKEEEKIAKDKAEKEEGIAKRVSKKMTNTAANVEEKVNKISNEKADQITKIAKGREEQMEIIEKEKAKQLEKITKEKREELEKIANDREKRLEEISKRETEEIEKIKKRKEDEIKEIRNVKKERMQTITNEKEKKIETIYNKKEEKRKKKGKDDKQTAVRESHKVQGSNEQSKEKKCEDDACDVKLAGETDSLLPTKMSNVHVNPATESQITTDTIIQVNELASHHDTSEAPTGTQDQTSQAVDKGGNPVKQKNNEDIESNGKANKESSCAVS